MQKMPSSSPIILFLFLLQVAQIQGDCTRPSFSGSIVLSQDSVKGSYTEGETARVACTVGYVPVDSAVSRLITCTGNQWTTPQLKCKKKTCGHPGEITNGRYLMQEGIDFGATITAQCSPGYRVIGVNIRRCFENGWSGKPLECEPISKCLKPADIKDGKFEPVEDSYDFGHVVSYSCVGRDFTLIGSEDITCYENGTFYPDPPQCLVVRCPEPDVPNGNKVEGKMRPPYTYKNFIKYRCDDDYRMNGTDTIICEANVWNPPPPRCDAITNTASASPPPKVPPQPRTLHTIVGVILFLVLFAITVAVTVWICRKKKKAARRSFAQVDNKTDDQVLPTGEDL